MHQLFTKRCPVVAYAKCCLCPAQRQISYIARRFVIRAYRGYLKLYVLAVFSELIDRRMILYIVIPLHSRRCIFIHRIIGLIRHNCGIAVNESAIFRADIYAVQFFVIGALEHTVDIIIEHTVLSLCDRTLILRIDLSNLLPELLVIELSGILIREHIAQLIIFLVGQIAVNAAVFTDIIHQPIQMHTVLNVVAKLLKIV